MYVETNPKHTGSYNSALRAHWQVTQTMRYRTIFSTKKAQLTATQIAHWSNSTAQKPRQINYTHTLHRLLCLPQFNLHNIYHTLPVISSLKLRTKGSLAQSKCTSNSRHLWKPTIGDLKSTKLQLADNMSHLIVKITDTTKRTSFRF